MMMDTKSMMTNDFNVLVQSKNPDERVNSAALHLADIIRNIRTETRTIPATADVVYLADAADICNIGLTGEEVNRIMIKQENADAHNKLDDFMKQHGPVLMVIAMSLAAFLITVLVMSYIYKPAP